MTFITALLDYSTCFGRLLHPSLGVQQLYMQPVAQVHCIYSSTPDDGCKKHPKHVEYILCHVGRRSSDVYLCQRLHIQLYSWWWVQETPETIRVVKKCSNKGHCPVASCWFTKYRYVMHGTMNLKFQKQSPPWIAWFHRATTNARRVTPQKSQGLNYTILFPCRHRKWQSLGGRFASIPV